MQTWQLWSSTHFEKSSEWLRFFCRDPSSSSKRPKPRTETRVKCLFSYPGFTAGWWPTSVKRKPGNPTCVYQASCTPCSCLARYICSSFVEVAVSQTVFTQVPRVSFLPLKQTQFSFQLCGKKHLKAHWLRTSCSSLPALNFCQMHCVHNQPLCIALNSFLWSPGPSGGAD